MSAPGFECVAAGDAERGIARDGGLPWRLPGDMAHFKRTTTATEDPAKRNAVIMGRKTWSSLGAKYQPLPGRLNVVLSRRDAVELPEGVVHARSLDEALAALAARDDVESIYVCGGGVVYAEAVKHPACRGIVYTRIAASYDCDTFFPAFEDDYVLDEVQAELSDGDVGYRIEVWRPRS